MISYIFLTLANVTVCFIIGYYGRQRKIGFAISFLISLLLTPLIGIICVLMSERIDSDGDQGTNQKTEKSFDLERYRKS